MSEFSVRSKSVLSSCDPRLQVIMYEVVNVFDCSITCGHRTPSQQEVLVKEGKSKTLNSKHCFYPALAVDVVPYPKMYNADKQDFLELWKHVSSVATKHGWKIRWGGDWDSDGDTEDQTFNDLAHFELMEKAL